MSVLPAINGCRQQGTPGWCGGGEPLLSPQTFSTPILLLSPTSQHHQRSQPLGQTVLDTESRPVPLPMGGAHHLVENRSGLTSFLIQDPNQLHISD